MALVRVNASEDGLEAHDVNSTLGDAIAQASDGGPDPAIIMVHGYKYAPHSDRHCPHKKIYAAQIGRWPRALGFGTGTPNEGVAIAFGWYARGSLRAAHKRSALLGRQLAALINLLKQQRPDRPINIISHSMGAQIALNSLQHLPRCSVGRLALLSGACFHSTAQSMLATPAGRDVEVLNITSRENDLFDAAFERLLGGGMVEDRAIGQGIDAANVATLQIDCPAVLDALGAWGIHIASPERRICHWSSYKRPGVMELYRRFLYKPTTLEFASLRNLRNSSDPRWSRLINIPSKSITSNVLALPRRERPIRWLNHVTDVVTRKEKNNEHAY